LPRGSRTPSPRRRSGERSAGFIVRCCRNKGRGTALTLRAFAAILLCRDSAAFAIEAASEHLKRTTCELVTYGDQAFGSVGQAGHRRRRQGADRRDGEAALDQRLHDQSIAAQEGGRA